MLSEMKQPIKTQKSVGEEFMEWAEKYWNIEKISEPTNSKNDCLLDDNEECCDYNHIRNIFIDKINKIIKNRLL